MDFRSTILLTGLILIVSTGCVMAEETAGNLTADISENTSVTASNQSAPAAVSDEALMNLALNARSYALENGTMAATSAFSDQASFVKDGMYVSAYDTRGVLLADPFKGGQIGSPFITDDHDAGLVRQLRDLANSGGGIFKPEGSGGLSYYALDVDGSWWLVAVSGR